MQCISPASCVSGSGIVVKCNIVRSLSVIIALFALCS